MGQGVASHQPSQRGYHTASRSQSQTAQAPVPLRAAPGLPRGRAAPSPRVPYERQHASVIGDRVARRAASPRQRGRWRGSRVSLRRRADDSGDDNADRSPAPTPPFATGSRRKLKEVREGLRAPGGQRPQAHNACAATLRTLVEVEPITARKRGVLWSTSIWCQRLRTTLDILRPRTRR
jgi:hypothetical protein